MKDVTFSGIFNSKVYFGDHKNIEDSGLTSYNRIEAFVIDIFKRLGWGQGTVEIQVVDNEEKRPSFTLILSQQELNKWKDSFIESTSTNSHGRCDSKSKYHIKIKMITRISDNTRPIFAHHNTDPKDWSASQSINAIILLKTGLIDQT